MKEIKPDEFIDCGVCEPECPIDAIEPDTNNDTSEWVTHNTGNTNRVEINNIINCGVSI